MEQEAKENADSGNVRVTASLEGGTQSLSIEVPASLTVSLLRCRLAEQHGRPQLAEMLVTVEDQAAPAAGETTMSELFSGAHRGRVHFHHCNEVPVTVEYNTKTHTHPFHPSTTVHRVFVWAISKDAFHLEADAHDLELQQPGAPSALPLNIHLGTLASDCRLKLELVPKDRPQGGA